MKKFLLISGIVVFLILFSHFELGQYLTLDYVKSQQAQIDQFYQQNVVVTIVGFFLMYIVVTAASLPGAAIMTLAAGAIFGFLNALIIVSFASSIGASLAFLVSRYLFRDSIQEKFVCT